mgnify:FL=1
MPTDLPHGTTLGHIDAYLAEPLERPCCRCRLAEAEPPTFDLCGECIADDAATLPPTHKDGFHA